MATADIISEIQAILGPGGVLTGDDVRSRSAGWLTREPLRAAALLRPRSTEEVSEVLRICQTAGQPVVPHGGLTGLVEGGLALEHEIALSLELMNTIEQVDADGLTMTVEAGV
ncbi:MAG TPA: FAD-binding protein, partial [Bryobacteraceae bacterium]|nr:FAD-binding protein [Bryobacteraceae bacterium]